MRFLLKQTEGKVKDKELTQIFHNLLCLGLWIYSVTLRNL